MKPSVRAKLTEADKAARAQLERLPNTDVLLVAPPGCGKTEGLARRATALVEREFVTPPSRVLGLTFSNRARDNLKERIASHLTKRSTRVTVTNIHGLSFRVIRAHGELIGIDSDWLPPQKGWRSSLLNEVCDRNRDRRDQVEAILRDAKSSAIDDAEVRRRLEEVGNEDAIAFEQMRISDRRLDYQDLLRHAQRLLSRPEVRHPYRLHFAAVLLDEAQDLTTQQLEIVLAIGEGRLTAAADLEQGIYTFAGANARAVLARLRANNPSELRLYRSFRSTDAVLECVNALGSDTSRLIAAEPDRWSDSGVVTVAGFDTKDEESSQVAECISRIGTSGSTTIGLICRHRYRRDALIQELAERDIPHAVWDRPTDNPVIGRLLRGLLSQIDDTTDDVTKLDELISLARWEIDPANAELLDALVEARHALRDLLSEISLDDAVERCRRDSPSRAVPPGVSVLTGHEGKGQQFDWVFVIGVEEGTIPHYRAQTKLEVAEEKRLLRVMASRAKYGVVFTHVRGWFTQYRTWRNQTESRWLPAIHSVANRQWKDLMTSMEAMSD